MKIHVKINTRNIPVSYLYPENIHTRDWIALKTEF